MPYAHTIRGERFVFADLRELLAKANEAKSGDELAGLAAASERERVAAKLALADVTLGEIVDNPVIDPDADDVSRLILDAHDRERVRRHPVARPSASSANSCSTTRPTGDVARGAARGRSRPRWRRPSRS